MNNLQIEKTLSLNDTGGNGSNQAGVLIPKGGEFLEFFPKLDASSYNPRLVLDFIDDAGKEWSFSYIYYNNRLFGSGTRNEFRLTGMTAFFRDHSLKPGDTLIIRRKPPHAYEISYRRANDSGLKTGTIKLGTGNWRLIELSDDD
jgi:hypothetical protein